MNLTPGDCRHSYRYECYCCSTSMCTTCETEFPHNPFVMTEDEWCLKTLAWWCAKCRAKRCDQMDAPMCIERRAAPEPPPPPNTGLYDHRPSTIIEPLIDGHRVVCRVLDRIELHRHDTMWDVKYTAYDATGRTYDVFVMDDPRAADAEQVAAFQEATKYLPARSGDVIVRRGAR